MIRKCWYCGRDMQVSEHINALGKNKFIHSVCYNKITCYISEEFTCQGIHMHVVGSANENLSVIIDNQGIKTREIVVPFETLFHRERMINALRFRFTSVTDDFYNAVYEIMHSKINALFYVKILGL